MQYNRHKLRNLIYILILTIFVSCSERVELNLENDEKLQIECTLVPGKEITATLSTVSNFADIENIIYPENARIYLLTQIDAPFEFKYDEESKTYKIPVKVHTPRSDWKYEIRAYLKDMPENELNAKTIFYNTTAVKIKDAIWDKTNNKLQLKTQLAFASKLSNPYLKINTFYKEVNENGDLSELVPLNFVENTENPLSFYNNQYTDGIYVNIDRVDYSNFSMVFNYPEVITSKEEISDYIYFFTNAISEPLYRYQVARAKHVNSINGGNSDPVITYTNINNGFGVFGSSVGKLDSIKVK